MLTPIYKTEYERQLLSQEQATMLTILLASEDSVIAEMVNDIREEKLYQLIDRRSTWLDLNMEDRLKIFLVFLCENPAHNSIYQHACWNIACASGFKNPVTLTDFCSTFGDGFPTEQAMSDFWTKQKTSGGKNLVDIKEGYTGE